jgi:hypothetical protein
LHKKADQKPMNILPENENLRKGDYVSVVVNAIGDFASVIPGYGSFITAVKNVGVNIASAKQHNRVISLLTELASRIDGIENVFNLKSLNDDFLILFYRLLYLGRDELDNLKQEAYIIVGKKLLETELPFDETRQAIEILAAMTPYEIRLLEHFRRFAIEWKKIEDILSDESVATVVGTSESNAIKDLLVQLWKKGLIKELHHGAILGQVSSDDITAFKLSGQGDILLNLISPI